MSVSIMWRPVKSEKSIHGGSSLWETLQEAFGDGRFQLTGDSLHTLNGIKAAVKGDEKLAIQQLMDAVLDFEVIEVFPEY